MMDIEQKIKANEIIIYNISQNVDEIWKVHNHYKSKLLSI